MAKPRAHREFAARHGLKDHGYLQALEARDAGNTGSQGRAGPPQAALTPSGGGLGLSSPGGSEGISHAMVAELYALPGQLLVGTDSHTPHSGALGCVAYGGSCTAGKREDFDHYHAVLAWAAQRGLRVAPGVQLYLQFGTAAVRDYCTERGYLAAFEAVGAELLQPACGACANCGPGSSTQSDQVTVSAINRNFPGRSGPGQVWLASPPTVAASAIAGRLCSFEALQASV